MGLVDSTGLTEIDMAKGELPSGDAASPASNTSPPDIASKGKERDLDSAVTAGSEIEGDSKAGTAKVAAPVAESPDAVILARAQSGDHAAFAQLYALHKRRVYSLCLRMLGNVAEAEDLTQESFLQLHRKIATFRG